MNEIYGLPNEGRTAIAEERRLDSKKWLTMPDSDRPIMSPTEADYIKAGWVKYVKPVVDQKTQKQGPVSISATEYTYLAIDKTAEELAAAAAILSRQEIIEFKKASPEAVELHGKTDAWINDKIEELTAGTTNPEIVAGIREVQKRHERMIRDLINVIKAMVS